LIGKGLFGDREALKIVSGVTTYVHNIFLEIWIDFGLIFGTFFIIAVLFLLIRGLLIEILTAEIWYVILYPCGL